MSYIKAVQEWASGNDFEHLYQEADGAGNVGFSMSFDENQTPVMVRGYDEPQILQVFVFLQFKAKKSAFNHLFQMFNHIYDSMPFGRFTLSDEGEVAFSQSVTLGDVMPNKSVIEEMVGGAYLFLNSHFTGIADVASKKLSFEEWKEQLPKK
jgi:hypothetical protein